MSKIGLDLLGAKPPNKLGNFNDDGKHANASVKTPDGVGTVYMRVGTGSPLDEVIVDMYKDNGQVVRKTYPVSQVQAMTPPSNYAPYAAGAAAAKHCHAQGDLRSWLFFLICLVLFVVAVKFATVVWARYRVGAAVRRALVVGARSRVRST